MAKEFIANAANIYLLPLTEGEGDATVYKYQTMAELILMTIEADYVFDNELHIRKTQALGTTRVHISLPNLGKHIEALTAIRDHMEAFAVQDEQQRSGVDPAQMVLPGV